MIYVYTLGFNLVSEVQKATERLYAQNEHNFKHLIVDLGFPLTEGDVIPENIEEAKNDNSNALKFLANRFGSQYVKFENIGVSQNTTQVINYLKPTEEVIEMERKKKDAYKDIEKLPVNWFAHLLGLFTLLKAPE